MAKIELTRNLFLKNALKSRYPQLAVFIVMLVGYVFAILAGLIGTPVGCVTECGPKNIFGPSDTKICAALGMHGFE